MNLVDTLKSKGVEIALNSISSIPVFGGIISTVGRILLNDDKASEEQIKNALEKASPEQLHLIKLEVEKSQNELNSQKEKTNQEELITKRKALDFIQNIMGKRPLIYTIIYSILFYSIMLGVLSYCAESKKDLDSVETAVIALCIIYITFPIAIIFPPMYKIIDAIADSIVHIINIPRRL